MKYLVRLCFVLLPALQFTAGSVSAQQSCIDEARTCYRNGDFACCISVLNSCEEGSLPENSELLISACFQAGDLLQANNLVNAIPDSLLTINLMHLKARVAQSRGDADVAFGIFRMLSDSDTNSSVYAKQTAICAEKCDSADAAVFYYKRALRLFPADQMAAAKLVDYFFRDENWDAADSLSALMLQKDTLPDVCKVRGDLLYRQKKYDEAYRCYEFMIRTVRNNPGYYRKAGICLFMKGEPEPAITFLSVANALRPDDDVTCYYLSAAYRETGNVKQSEAFLQCAIDNSINENISLYYSQLSKLYENDKKFSKALTALRNAYKYSDKKSPESATYQYEMGRMYEVYMKDTMKAIEYYDSYLDAYTDTSDAQYKLIRDRTARIKSEYSSPGKK